MRTAYWHKIPKADQEAILDFGRMTVGEFRVRYKQPAWCTYPDALDGMWGCWSLTTPGWVINETYCKDCPCRKEKP